VADRSSDLATPSTDSPEEEHRGLPTRRTYLFLIVDCAFPLDGGGRFLLDDTDEVAFLGRRIHRRAAREDGRRLCLKVRSKLVSEEHAHLKRTPNGLVLEDAGSKNGTFLNGQRISGRARVRPGDLLRMGDVFFTVREFTIPEDAGPSPDILDAASAEAMPLPNFPTMVPPLAAELTEMRKAIASSGPIIILGETGAGKEVLARAIHAASGRNGRLVAVNCPGLTTGLADGQLFGFVKGAYSGASHGDPGLVRQADGGTLLFDEIPDLPLEIQAKLLRLIQEHEIVPLGKSRSERVDVRILAATQRSLGDLVAAGRFRADLRFRLEQYVMEIPPLRHRREDLGLLIATMLRGNGVDEQRGLTIAVKEMEDLIRYDWPENVRGLEHRLVASLTTATGGVLRPRVETTHVHSSVAGEAEKVEPSAADARRRAELAALLEKHRGNVSAVAQEISRSRKWTYQLLDRFELDASGYRTK
jgi:sigma-54 dependent transcriptional regulator, acetoin dehydrogenase operon transcriptional activator AcoR